MDRFGKTHQSCYCSCPSGLLHSTPPPAGATFLGSRQGCRDGREAVLLVLRLLAWSQLGPESQLASVLRVAGSSPSLSHSGALSTLNTHTLSLFLSIHNHNACTYIHKHTHIHTHTIHTYTHSHTHSLSHTHTHTYIHKHTYSLIHILTCSHTHTHSHKCMHMYTCMHTCTHAPTLSSESLG